MSSVDHSDHSIRQLCRESCSSDGKGNAVFFFLPLFLTHGIWHGLGLHVAAVRTDDTAFPRRLYKLYYQLSINKHLYQLWVHRKSSSIGLSGYFWIWYIYICRVTVAECSLLAPYILSIKRKVPPQDNHSTSTDIMWADDRSKNTRDTKMHR